MSVLYLWLDRGLLSDYDIIIDEVPEVVRSVSSKSKVSIEEFYLNTGYMTVDTKDRSGESDRQVVVDEG
jgi:hypothetical protein